MDPRSCGPMWTLTLLLVSACPLCCGASWMQLGLSPAGPPEDQDQDQDQACAGLPLSPPQSLLLRERPSLLPAVRLGARLAMKECRSQFRHERWNCSSMLGPEASSGTKETAFIHAMMAAGLVHAVTRSCSHGNATRCGCGAGPRGAWRWGGCSDPLRYGIRFSRQFIDDGAANGSRSAMNRHNSETGRQAVVRTMAARCRCHGVSGSCAVKTCWKTLAAPELVGAHLKERYERSTRLWDRSGRKTRRKDRLVFLNKSPNYCLADARRGVAGTRGRRCSRTSGGADGCVLLCCGRGYDTQLVRRQRRCHCKFSWCCHVRCRRCESMDDLHTCK
ncbi:protein Wnt-16 [Pseudoliparis swirei]|uniref:protein Wnt-16 n=1 Tax=Pseudoliparis swirei TaxID=2059687 RepID=UPI0024BE59ED|nr:protein Wnt-16 [Pseudoliparis swirei]